jgi:hypothetical protein
VGAENHVTALICAFAASQPQRLTVDDEASMIA